MVLIDEKVKMQGWERKSVLRNIIGKTLLKSLLQAPKKGFGIPLTEWFKTMTFNEALEINLNNINTIFDDKTIENIVLENNNGLRDSGNFIWQLIMLNKTLN